MNNPELLNSLNLALNAALACATELGHVINDLNALVERVGAIPDQNVLLPMSQRDTRWANIRLGTSDLTIGESGCLITDMAAALYTTPNILNTWLVEHGGYLDGANLIWASLESLGLKFEGIVSCPKPTDTPIQRIKDALAAGQIVVAKVDFNPATTKVDQHWVLIQALDELNAKIMDPWPQPPDSNLIDLCPKYGKTPAIALWAVAFYSRKTGA